MATDGISAQEDAEMFGSATDGMEGVDPQPSYAPPELDTSSALRDDAQHDSANERSVVAKAFANQ